MGFIERGDNLLVCELPGRGKSHLVCAVGHDLAAHFDRVLTTLATKAEGNQADNATDGEV